MNTAAGTDSAARQRVLATALGVVTAAAAVSWLALLAMNGDTVTLLRDLPDIASVGGQAALWGATGVLLARRRPDLVVGWLFLAVGVISSLYGALSEYAVRSVAGPALPGAQAAAYAAGGLHGVALVPIVLLLLLYPDGRLPSRRWHPFLWATLLAIPVLAIPLKGGAPYLANYRSQSTGVHGVGGDVGDLLWLVGALLSYPSLLAAAIGVLVRYRRSRGVERLQLEWAGFAGLLAVLALLASALPASVVGELHHVSGVLLVYGLPVCAGIAILRYRLYEIDRVVSRTVSYAVVTVPLAAVYAASILGFGALVPGRNSDLLVAGSTLLVAALFQPVRRRVQIAVDRRFNRSRYDAQRMLAAYAQMVRDEVDLGVLTAGLVTTTSETVQPAHASVWLVPTRS